MGQRDGGFAEAGGFNEAGGVARPTLEVIEIILVTERRQRTVDVMGADTDGSQAWRAMRPNNAPQWRVADAVSFTAGASGLRQGWRSPLWSNPCPR